MSHKARSLQEAYNQVHNEAIDPLLADPRNTDVGPLLVAIPLLAHFLYNAIKEYLTADETEQIQLALHDTHVIKAMIAFLNMPNSTNKAEALRILSTKKELKDNPKLLMRVFDALRNVDIAEFKAKDSL